MWLPAIEILTQIWPPLWMLGMSKDMETMLMTSKMWYNSQAVILVGGLSAGNYTPVEAAKGDFWYMYICLRKVPDLHFSGPTTGACILWEILDIT